MVDFSNFPVGKAIQSEKGYWYRKLQDLGTGKNASTFLVVATEGPHRGILFALKVFQRLSSEESRQRFADESRFLQANSHPAIMKVYDAGVFRDSAARYPFIVAEYLPFRLADLIATKGVSTVEKISYAFQLLSALAYLSGLDPPVIHRDIKPENILLKGKSCVLGDFGLMKRQGPIASDDQQILRQSTGAAMPSRYRTPDLVAYARGEEPITCASDVFQLGIVLAELFVGINPIQPADDVLAPVTMEQIAQIPGALGASVASMIRRMLRHNPADRPSVHELQDNWQSAFLEAAEQANKQNGWVV